MIDDEVRQYTADLKALVKNPFDPRALKEFVRAHRDDLGPDSPLLRVLDKGNKDPVLKMTYELIKKGYAGTRR